MPNLDEQQLAKLIAILPPAPEAWVQAAQQLPAARHALDTLVARAQASSERRQIILSDLQAALQDEGVEPHPGLVHELRARLDPHDQ